MSTIIAVVITLCVVAPITWAVATAHRKNAYESKIGTAEEKARKGRIMTKKERVLHAFHNEPVDRVPIAFWYHFSPDDDFGQETIDEHLRLYREADFDLIKVMCDGYFNYPNPGIAQIKKPEDWFNLKPMGPDHPFIRKQIARVKGVVEAVKDECCFFFTYNKIHIIRKQILNMNPLAPSCFHL